MEKSEDTEAHSEVSTVLCGARVLALTSLNVSEILLLALPNNNSNSNCKYLSNKRIPFVAK